MQMLCSSPGLAEVVAQNSDLADVLIKTPVLVQVISSNAEVGLKTGSGGKGEGRRRRGRLVRAAVERGVFSALVTAAMLLIGSTPSHVTLLLPSQCAPHPWVSPVIDGCPTSQVAIQSYLACSSACLHPFTPYPYDKRSCATSAQAVAAASAFPHQHFFFEASMPPPLGCHCPVQQQ